MHKLAAKLPAFALPFVTRSLRGGRGKRYLLISLLIAAVTVLLGLWISLGNGRFEQELRVDLGLEQYEFEREQQEFVLYVHDEWELRAAERELERVEAGDYSQLGHDSHDFGLLVENGQIVVLDAAGSWPQTKPEHRALQERAQALAGSDEVNGHHFSWNHRGKVAQLETILARGAIPEVRAYESPLGLGDALRIIGFLAGLLLAGCVTVFGPLLVAVQQAQERHENTLMPLTGTSLSPRQLALGLASGPSAVIAIFALPQLALFGACALAVGEPGFALGLLGALAASSLFLSFAGQLLGQLVGHRRTPGMVGIALLSLLGMAWLIGAAMTDGIPRDMTGLAAVLPTLGLAALLAETFVETTVATLDLEFATLAWSGAALVFGWLALSALSRKLEGREGPVLDALPALVGALTCVGLVHVALPSDSYDAADVRLYLGLAMLALPFALLLMGRVPSGDGPVRLRRVPVLRLLGEFAAWGAAHVLLTAALLPLDAEALHPVAMLWMLWCVGTLGLISIRLVAVPANVPAHLWTGFCALTLIMGFMQAVVWGTEHSRQLDELFLLAEVSPVLGLLQVAVTIAVPLTLVRHLRKNLGSLS